MIKKTINVSLESPFLNILIMNGYLPSFISKDLGGF
jgi:hypothetical protein